MPPPSTTRILIRQAVECRREAPKSLCVVGILPIVQSEFTPIGTPADDYVIRVCHPTADGGRIYLRAPPLQE